MVKKKIALVLGIRPDIIRAAILIKLLRANTKFDVQFIWSGQHYSSNLKDIFFRQLGVPLPDIELGVQGVTDAEIVAGIISQLSKVLTEMKPEAVIFLGDTNTVAGCIAAAQLNIPIIHIEGCMRSYDWRMPEEKYRTVIDHVSDVIYTYFDEYKIQGCAEGLNPQNIVVVGNLIVDVLNEYYFQKKAYYDTLANDTFFTTRGIEKGRYYLMTCHRRENLNAAVLKNIFNLVADTVFPVFFPAGYRTQALLKEFGLKLPSHVIMVDPVGYEDMLCLIVNSRGVITDSGTIVEETCVLKIPSIQMRKSTERPQVYDARSSVKFDPALPEAYPSVEVLRKFESLYQSTWEHNLGDGNASRRIMEDLERRLATGFNNHTPESYHIPTMRPYGGDGLTV